MYALIIGLIVAVVIVVELIFGQVWLRFFYVFRYTIYRDDNPVGYWLVVGLQSLVALALLGFGGMSLLK